MEQPFPKVGNNSRLLGRLRLSASPLSLLVIVLLVLFAMEISVTLALAGLETLPSFLHVFLDSTLMLGLVFPALYLLMFRPLSRQISERYGAEHRLKEAHDELEQRVFDRTFELAAANVALQKEAAERRIAERERETLLAVVQQRAAEFDAIITSVADGLVVYGPQGEVVRTNSAARKLLCLSPDGAISAEHSASLCPTDDGRTDGSAQRDAPVMRALRGETVDGVVAPLRTPAGETRHVSISAAPVVAPDGKRLGAVVSLNDVTQLHEMHERLQDFVRGVTHDLRTPLTAIWGHSQLLTARAADADKKWLKNVDVISQSARRLKGLIDNLADTVLLEAGELEMQVEPVMLKDFLSGILERNDPTIDVRRIRLVLAPDLPPVQADVDRLERIFLNLLTNALKYSPRHSEVVVKAQASGPEVVLSVQDRGTGMAPEELQQIFDRACELRTSRQAGGLGLGLFITKMLVEAHRGHIWAESAEGKGSTFYFTLPTA